MFSHKRRTGAMALVATSAMLLTACGGTSASDSSSDGSTASAGGDSNGTINAAVAYSTKNFDPVGSSSALALGANWHVMEGLYDLDMHNFEPYAALAKDEPKEISDTEYEVTLRDDAKFSDGTPVTADDVVFSAEKNMDNGLYASMLSFIDSVTKKDDSTVTIKLKYPFSLMKNRLSLIKIVKSSQTDEERTTMPIGTGPWMYKSIDEKELQFVPNPNYNGSLPAKAGAMNFSIIQDDVARTTAMQGGTVDVMESVPNQSRAVLESAGAKIEEVQGFNLPFLMFNTKKAPYNDEKVRQAFFYAIDTDKLIDDAMHGEATPAKSFLPENHPNYHEASNVFNHDTDKAKSLLQEGKAEGLEVNLLTTDHPWITALVPQIKQDLEAAGLTVNVNSMASAALYKQKTAGDNPEFDVVLAPGDPSVFGNDPDLLMNWWYGPGAWTKERSGWYGSDGYNELHKHMDAAARATGNEQQEEWNKAFDILSEQVPLYPLFHRQVVTAYNTDKVSGYQPISTTGLDFLDASAK